MKENQKDLWKALLLCVILTINLCQISVMAAEAENTATSAPEAPAKPESYDWEIQSNKIPGWPQGPKVVAETAILMDIDSGSILYAKGIDEKRAPASTTKIMTAMLALERCHLTLRLLLQMRSIILRLTAHTLALNQAKPSL